MGLHLDLTLKTQLLANAVGQNLDRNLPKTGSIPDGCPEAKLLR